MLRSEDNWYREGSGRRFRSACGSRVRLVHRFGEEFLDLPWPHHLED